MYRAGQSHEIKDLYAEVEAIDPILVNSICLSKRFSVARLQISDYSRLSRMKDPRVIRNQDGIEGRRSSTHSKISTFCQLPCHAIV